MARIRYWRVTFHGSGKPLSVSEIDGPGHDDWVVVKAASEALAGKKAAAVYAARKKRERARVLKAEGKCSCGRPLDGAVVERGSHAGQPHTKCATCRERRKSVWVPNHKARVANGTVGQGVAERDEMARLAKNLDRQRDRRAEIRLETLVDVRRAWQDAKTTGCFMKWLVSEIQRLTGESPKSQAAA